MSVVILRGDAAHLPLPDGSADLIVTSPPYWALRSYADGGEHCDGQIGAEATPREYIAALLDCTREWMRVLKPSGSLFVNLGDKYSERASPEWRGSSDGYTGRHDKGRRSNTTEFAPRKSLLGLPWRYALGCIDDLSLILRAEIIWDKPGAMPESVTDRVRRSHEQVFHFVKQPRYFAGVDELREPHIEIRARDMTWHQRKVAGEPARLGEQTVSRRASHRLAAHPLGRLPGSVWEIPAGSLAIPAAVAHARCCGNLDPVCERGLEHRAAYPLDLCRRIILGWSPPDGVVADPFGGSGTTALTADVLGRTGISIDLSMDYGRIAQWRTADPGERARALGVPKPPPVPEGQGSLFDDLEAS